VLREPGETHQVGKENGRNAALIGRHEPRPSALRAETRAIRERAAAGAAQHSSSVEANRFFYTFEKSDCVGVNRSATRALRC
jgi:hypothetical protein